MQLKLRHHSEGAGGYELDGGLSSLLFHVAGFAEEDGSLAEPLFVRPFLCRSGV